MEKLNIQSLLNEYYLVVPEIQREYVWGSKRNEIVLAQFLKDLDEKLSKGETNIGFLYSYKSGEEHYLIDGQQRYTTLILLLHYITVKEGSESHLNYVNAHHLDSYLPAFSYRVRSQTESFLKNLLTSSAINAKMVQQQKWYKSIYGNDTTILSMMGALDTIDKNWGSFSNFSSENILNNVYFWYFDVEKTSQGEELYITMNSRGEKLTDPEQIKPRLLNKIKEIKEKESFGKKWDNWEEFFFDQHLRNGRKIGSIDSAMNNVIRIVLELVTCREHNKIYPVEDSELISLYDIECYMSAIETLSKLFNGKYRLEIERLYGDIDGDGNFIVLKALLSEIIKKQENEHEFERIYQTTLNHVRRNKIKNIDFLLFLKEYVKYDGSFYEFIINSESDIALRVINGHELEKVSICASTEDVDYEKSIWDEQSLDFWNGEMKSLIAWSKKDGVFSFNEFERIRNNFHKLFKARFEKDDWTSDSVRQALIAYQLPYYPLENGRFGYSREEWKEVFKMNSQRFLDFLDLFDNIESANIPNVLETIKQSYKETQSYRWVDFVKYDYLLQYCNTKHLYWTDSSGWILVKNSWAKPFSVKNLRLYHVLLQQYGDFINEWGIYQYISWDSSVYIQNDRLHVYFDIRYLRNPDDTYYLRIDLSKRGVAVEDYEKFKHDLLRFIPSDITMVWDEKDGRFVWYPKHIEEVYRLITYITKIIE